ncbi:MAG TPA: hypothetical protein PK280_06660 [Planctomycetota bacterium]|nr:hypothetical protein [Planctomycetota bacterium]
MPSPTPAPTGCCPPFDPAPWDGKEIVWQDKLFVKDRVRSFLHIPLNFGKVVVRNMEKIWAAQAADKSLMVCDENSLWGADLYIAVTKEVPGTQGARLTGRFVSRAYDIPYREVGDRARELSQELLAAGRPAEKILSCYTTCPKCAKAYGHNYIVLLAKVG